MREGIGLINSFENEDGRDNSQIDKETKDHVSR
jgi:hypothetical protein